MNRHYQGLQTDLERYKLGAWSLASTETRLSSVSVSSRSEQRSSLEVVEGAGDKAEEALLTAGDSVAYAGSPGQVPPLLESVMRSDRMSWKRSSSFRGMHSRRWLSRSAAMVASIPGQLDTKVCTSCMHWMYPAAKRSLASRFTLSASAEEEKRHDVTTPINYMRWDSGLF